MSNPSKALAVSGLGLMVVISNILLIQIYKSNINCYIHDHSPKPRFHVSNFNIVQ